MNENNYLESSNIYTTYLSRILYLHTNKIYFRLYRFRPGWLGPGWFQPSQKTSVLRLLYETPYVIIMLFYLGSDVQ